MPILPQGPSMELLEPLALAGGRRHRRGAPGLSPKSTEGLEEVHAVLSSLQAEVEQLRRPHGTPDSPGRACAELRLSHPHLPDGDSQGAGILESGLWLPVGAQKLGGVGWGYCGASGGHWGKGWEPWSLGQLCRKQRSSEVGPNGASSSGSGGLWGEDWVQPGEGGSWSIHLSVPPSVVLEQEGGCDPCSSPSWTLPCPLR